MSDTTGRSVADVFGDVLYDHRRRHRYPTICTCGQTTLTMEGLEQQHRAHLAAALAAASPDTGAPDAVLLRVLAGFYRQADKAGTAPAGLAWRDAADLLAAALKTPMASHASALCETLHPGKTCDQSSAEVAEAHARRADTAAPSECDAACASWAHDDADSCTCDAPSPPAAPVDATLTDSERDLLWWTVKSREAFARVERVVERILAQRADVDHAKIERAFTTEGLVPEPVLSDAHARYHDQPGNLIGGDECEWEACPFWEIATFTRDHLRAALGDTTNRPPLCPSRWANNRGVHCAEREGHPGQHGNGVVSWSEAEAAG